MIRAEREGAVVLRAQQIGTAHAFLPGVHVEGGEGLVRARCCALREELGVDVRVVRYLDAVEHLEEEVLTALGNERLTETEIRERVGGDQGEIGKAIRRLYEDGTLNRSGRGVRGDRYVYWRAGEPE